MKAKTVIVDLDGCVLKHHGRGACHQWKTYDLLPFVKETFDEWERRQFCVVIMSARKECCRREIEAVLRTAGLFWDHLVLGVTSGERVVINDVKEGRVQTEPSVRAVRLPRNEGLKGVTNL